MVMPVYVYGFLFHGCKYCIKLTTEIQWELFEQFTIKLRSSAVGGAQSSGRGVGWYT